MTENTNRATLSRAAYSSPTGPGALVKSTGAGTAADPIIPYVQLTTSSIDIGAVSLIGDDGNVITGSKSDSAWDGAAASPTWTAIWKYTVARLTSILSAVTGLAQGSTTASQVGPLVQGAVTTSAPSYTTAQTNPLSLDTSGNLRATLAASGPVTAGTVATKSVLTGGQYNATPPTVADTQQVATQFDAKGSLKSIAVDPNGVVIDLTTAAQVYFSNSYNNITTKTTTTVKSGAGRIQSIQCNTVGTTDTLTVYDSLSGSGTKIATISSPTVGTRYCEGAAFGTGLTIVSGGTTAGDYTVYYT